MNYPKLKMKALRVIEEIAHSEDVTLNELVYQAKQYIREEDKDFDILSNKDKFEVVMAALIIVFMNPDLDKVYVEMTGKPSLYLAEMRQGFTMVS